MAQQHEQKALSRLCFYNIDSLVSVEVGGIFATGFGTSWTVITPTVNSFPTVS